MFRAQRNERKEFQAVTGHDTECITLENSCQEQLRLLLGEGHADADARPRLS